MVIFDFDQTLVNTSPVEALRAARQWRGVMAQAPKLAVYDGVSELLAALHEKGQPLAIVTKSPNRVGITDSLCMAILTDFCNKIGTMRRFAIMRSGA